MGYDINLIFIKRWFYIISIWSNCKVIVDVMTDQTEQFNTGKATGIGKSKSVLCSTITHVQELLIKLLELIWDVWEIAAFISKFAITS